ncbi:LysR family transcriptional regulator [Ornithinimicrobium faecis]|uniref:LysR family transcriptional regulator n=1 Tax=Ornithinimicrobium faecis TaxID=2934158 RepID=A0ABY4YVZ7_9MICO|nr:MULTISPECIES: LysR family transcriptional regulator [unclassified Ornithinimicrobium]USQ80938.1 LysR family transcriptional regulator [Ornithinimicrobium sp. HY1793]
MDVRHLELLRELAERGSVTAVARATHRTPSAVSQQLQTAQRELGAQLVEPLGRGLRLTEAGELLARRAVDVATVLAQVTADWDAFRHHPTGTVSIMVLPSAGEYLLPAALLELAGSGIEITCHDADVAEADWADLTKDHDIVIGHSLSDRRPPGTEALRVTRLVREPLDVALPVEHRLAGAESVRPEDLVEDPWIGVPLGFPFDTVLQAIEATTGAQLQVVQRVRDNRLVESLVAAGCGVAMLPRFTTRLREGVVLRPLVGVDTGRVVLAIQRPDRAARLAVQRTLAAIERAGADLGGDSAPGVAG